MPPVSAPSPMTATTWYFWFLSVRACAMPSATETESEAWPVMHGSVIALLRLHEAGEAAVLAQRSKTVPPAGQYLVDVALMADIVDDAVARGVELPLERYRQLDDAEIGGEMAARSERPSPR